MSPRLFRLTPLLTLLVISHLSGRAAAGPDPASSAVTATQPADTTTTGGETAASLPATGGPVDSLALTPGQGSATAASNAEPPSPAPMGSTWDKVWKHTSLSTKWFMSYAYGESEGQRFNRTHISRGYLTVKLKPVKWFQPRITLDAHQNEVGDFSVRLKYLHAKFILPVETAVITEPNVEVGLVHNPWFDYEEHINRYRMEGTMFIERNGVLNSADLGFTVGGLIGRKLDKGYRERVSSKYPGRYGSFALGVYNGGGYHAEEKNNDKVFMSRISLRPLGFIIPNWQISYFLIYGKGNTEEAPPWILHDVMTSFEHQYFVFTAQLTTGEGNAKGKKVDQSHGSLDYIGYSLFGEVKLPCLRSSVIARFDWFNWDTVAGDPATSRVIAGYAFHFYKKSFALLSVDRVSYDQAGRDADWQAKLTLQIQVP